MPEPHLNQPFSSLHAHDIYAYQSSQKVQLQMQDNPEIKALYKRKFEYPKQVAITPASIETFLEASLDLVFPGMLRKSFQAEEEFLGFFNTHSDHLKKILNLFYPDPSVIQSTVELYGTHLNRVSELLLEDAKALLNGDPAAQDLTEVVLSYPGLIAIGTYRIAHFFYQKKIPILPRMLSELAHARTGIDIHPGAVIGESFFIDHGTGVVIGETSVIGNRVKIYQGVTLGAMSVDKSLTHLKRHPTIEDDCVIYAHATILGGDTVVGQGSIIGGNVWLTQSTPKGSVVYHSKETLRGPHS